MEMSSSVYFLENVLFISMDCIPTPKIRQFLTEDLHQFLLFDTLSHDATIHFFKLHPIIRHHEPKSLLVLIMFFEPNLVRLSPDALHMIFVCDCPVGKRHAA